MRGSFGVYTCCWTGLSLGGFREARLRAVIHVFLHIREFERVGFGRIFGGRDVKLGRLGWLACASCSP